MTVRQSWEDQRTQGRDMDAEVFPDFSRIFEAYHHKVLAYATKLVGRDEADDIAQEVFVKVRRSLGTLADPSKLSSWIYTITLNTVRDAARKSSARVDRPFGANDSAHAGDEEDDAIARVADTTSHTPEEAVIRSEMVGCYLDYVNQLPPNYLEVYVLSEFEELANDQIARRLSISLGTVKIRLHRARTKLFEQLRQNCRCYMNERGELMATTKNR